MLSLRSLLLRVFMPLTLLPLLALGTTLSWWIYATHLQNVHTYEQNSARHVSVAVRGIFAGLKDDLMRLTYFQDFPMLAAGQQRDSMLEVLSRNPLLESLTMLDDLGREQLWVSRRNAALVSGKESRVWQDVLMALSTGADVYYGQVSLDAHSGEPVMRMAVPLRDLRSGRLVRIMVAEVQFRQISSHLLEQGQLEHERISLVTEQGLILAHPDPSHVLGGVYTHTPAGPEITRNFEGRWVVAAAWPLELGSRKLRVITERDAQAALAPALQSSLLVLLVTACMAGLAMWVTVYMVGRISRPVHHLTAQAEAIRSGTAKGVEPVHGFAEVEALATAFGTMTTRLQTTLSELEDEVAVRKDAEERLARSEAYYREVFDVSPAVKLIVDPEDDRIMNANNAAAGFYGYSNEQLRSMRLADISDDARSECETAATGTLDRALLCRHRTAAGDLRDVEIFSGLFRSLDRELLHFIIHDVTDKLRQEREIHNLYNQAPCGYHSLNADGIIVRINDTELEWLGYSREELVGRTRAVDLMTPASVDRFRQNYPRFLETGSVQELEMEFVRRDGTVMPMLVSGTAVFDEQGQFAMIRSVLVDYSRLRRERETLRGILETSPVAVSVVSLSDARILFMNDAFCRLMHLQRDEALGSDIRRSYADPAVFDALRAELAMEGMVMNRLVELHHPDLPEVAHIWALSSFMLFDYEGQPAVLGWLFDVTELHMARMEAEHANRELEAFSYAVAHDLGAPLRGMNGYSQILLEDYGPQLDDEGRKLLDNIMTASRRMGGLIEGLLELSRSNLSQLSCQQVDISAMVAGIRDRLEQEYPDRSVAWNIEGGVLVTADPQMFHLVMYNLLGNAWKYTGRTAGARIVFRTEQRDDQIWYVIEDNGAGFDMRHAELLFKPFQRLHRQDEFPGLGIGLATVQRIIRRHGGTIEAEATPGRGALFRFTISPSVKKVTA